MARRRKRWRREQPQVYDTSFKDWIAGQAEELLPLLLPGVVYEGTQNVEIIRSTMRADKVFKAKYHGVDCIVHLECETGVDSELPSRLLVYNSVLYHDYHLPVITIVIYPFHVKVAEPPLQVFCDDLDIVKFTYRTLLLYKQEAEYYVRKHATAMYPMLPTMYGANAELLEQAMGELFEAYSSDEARLAEQFVWMELLLERSDTVPLAEKYKIQERLAMFDKLWEESPRVQKMREQMRVEYMTKGYEEGIEKGIEKGKLEGEVHALQRALVHVVQARFPELRDLAQQQVQQLKNVDALDTLIQKITAAPDSHVAQRLLKQQQ